MLSSLSLHAPVSISFTDTLSSKELVSNDLICTAIARTAKEKKKIIIDCHQHTCAGGSHFVCGKKVNTKTILEIYKDKEHVFESDTQTNAFLKKVKTNPKKSKYILFEPTVNLKADVLLFFTNPAQAGKILGLSAYKDKINIDIIPAAATCISAFRPLVQTNTIHINFIDYFERELQAQDFFEKDELLLSMKPKTFQRLLKSYNASSHGTFVPHEVDIFPIRKLSKPSKKTP